MDVKKVWKYLITDPNKVKLKNYKSDNSKSVHNLNESTTDNKLGKGVILFVLINSILGSSLFYLPSLGVKSSGPASIIAWLLTFIFALFIMMYMGELITLHPTSGGTYTFCKRAYGRFLSFMSGWLIWIAGNLGMALAIVAASEYFIPESTSEAFLLRIIFSLIWIAALNYMAYRGIDAGITMLVAFGLFSLVVVSFMILPSFISLPSLFNGHFSSPFNFSFLEPFFIWDGLNNYSYLFLSMFFILEAFFGFETITYLANEAKEPKKLHKLLFSSMIICGLIMVIYIFSSLGVVSIQDYVNDARPFAVQAFNVMGEVGKNFVVFGMYLVIIGAAAAWPITSSRLLQAMAKDGLFLKQLSARHKKHKSPYRAVIFQSIIITLFTWLIFRGYLVKWGDPYRTLYLIYVLLGILVISLVLFTVPILRKKEKNVERPYKAPFPLFGPILIVGVLLLLVYNWVSIEGEIALSIINLTSSFIILGIPFYLLIEMYYDSNAIMKVNGILSYFVLATEKIHFPFSLRKDLLEELSGLKGKKILEYGCSVGSLTNKLVDKVGSKGKIISTDLAMHNVEIVNKRTKNIKHVSAHHHPHLNKFKLDTKLKFDFVISVGMLSYMQDPKRLLSDLSNRLNKGAEVYFIDYDKFFYFMPNIDWIEDNNKLKDLFKRSKMEVEIVRKRSLFWTYLLIKGKKM